MLKKFSVKNYKNFKETFTLDFSDVNGYQFNTDCITNGLIGKMMIYGRNATGKTNFGNALFDIVTNLSSFRYGSEDGVFLNADAEGECAEFVYIFQFGKDEVEYRYKKCSELEIKEEELIVNKISTFYIDFETIKWKLDNLYLINGDTLILDRFFNAIKSDYEDSEVKNINQPMSFLRFLINNTVQQAQSVLLKLNAFVSGMVMQQGNSNRFNRMPKRFYESFYQVLEEQNKLKDFENFLNAMGVDCKLKLEKLPDEQHELYFLYKKLVPFVYNMSSGTGALMNLYKRFVLNLTKPSLIYIDEFDAFYHYEMSEKIVLFLKEKYPNSQVILTTHNTNLLSNKIMRPDCFFIMAPNRITSFFNATPRELREGHNLEKMYISGEFLDYE